MYKSRFKSINQYMKEIEDSENSPENSEDSPCSPMSNDGKITSTSKKRRGVQKKVVLIPIKDVEGFRLKGDHMSAPPSDSWAWRKYGQKPIKGSPYPRGYYKCSSSKGCPARKQVERSKVDPTMLTVTYACEHNHPSPASRNHQHHTTKTTTVAAASVTTSLSDEEEELEEEIEEMEEEDKKPVVNIPTIQFQESISEYKFPNLPLINESEFGWLTDFESTIESPILAEDSIDTEELGMVFTMREEDELLFADLGELPECSTVFRRGMVGREAEQRRRELATTGCR